MWVGMEVCVMVFGRAEIDRYIDRERERDFRLQKVKVENTSGGTN